MRVHFAKYTTNNIVGLLNLQYNYKTLFQAFFNLSSIPSHPQTQPYYNLKDKIIRFKIRGWHVFY